MTTSLFVYNFMALFYKLKFKKMFLRNYETRLV